MKRSQALYGSSEEKIYKRVNGIIKEMIIDEIIQTTLCFENKRGKIIKFKLRNVVESNIEGIVDLDKIYDYICMLDAEGYPKVFIAMHGVKYEYSRVQQKADASFAMVKYSAEPKS